MKIFVWDRMAQSDATRRDTSCVEGMGGLSMPQVEVGGGGASPWETFFANLSSEKGILGQF